MNNQTKPLISVVTVCYNAVNELEETMLSVLNQTYDNIEYIVIDGGSKDGTVDVIKKYADKIAYWVSEPDKGIYDAMNKGIRAAKGEWINFMNAGDRFYDEEVIRKVFSRVDLCQYSLIYGDTVYLRAKSNEIEKAEDVSYIAKNMPTSHQSFFVLTRDAKELGFDMLYKYAADYHMIYTLYKKYGVKNICHLSVVVAVYEAQVGLSMQHQTEVYGETIRIRDFSFHQQWSKFKYYVKKITRK